MRELDSSWECLESWVSWSCFCGRELRERELSESGSKKERQNEKESRPSCLICRYCGLLVWLAQYRTYRGVLYDILNAFLCDVGVTMDADEVVGQQAAGRVAWKEEEEQVRGTERLKAYSTTVPCAVPCGAGML